MVVSYNDFWEKVILDSNSRILYNYTDNTKQIKIVYSMDDDYIYFKGKKLWHNKSAKKFDSYKKRKESWNIDLVASVWSDSKKRA